jgi:CheY-like chemotaxis protein
VSTEENAVPPVQTILIVEDDPVLSESIAELLTDAGYAVASAPNGADALAYLRSNAAPQLILLDLMMPVVDGFAFRREQLRDRTLARIPVIVLSAIWRNEQVHSIGAADWFTKPADIDALLHSISRNARGGLHHGNPKPERTAVRN